MNGNLAEQVYSVSEFYTSLEDSVVATIGEKQWSAMRSCEEKYDQLPMTDFGNVRFSDNVWYTNRQGTQFNWDNALLPMKQNFPLILLMKLSAYHRVQVQKYSSSSTCNAQVSFIKLWSRILGREHILSAKVNHPFVPADVITRDKFHTLCVEAVEQNDIASISLLDPWANILKLPEHIFKDVPFLRFNFHVPWHKIKNKQGDISPSQQYLNELLGESATRISVRSYKPFSSSVVAKIVDGALPIITTHADALTEILQTVHNNNPWLDQKKNNGDWGDIESTDSFLYDTNTKVNIVKSVLDNNIDTIKALPGFIDGCSEEEGHIPNMSWFYKLHDHCVTAAIWVISLTTGLRNIDIRLSLLRDCYVKDPDSDLIYYLVTDIQKVMKEDYPIPIPPQTKQAIDLLNAINFAPSKVDNLVTRMFLFGSAMYWHFNDGHLLNEHLREFALKYKADLLHGLEGDDRIEGVCHRGRVTMAQWIGTNSPLAVMIVKRLFGHANDIMPDHYLRHNKLVQNERKEIQKATYVDLSDALSEAIIDEKFSGGMSQRIKEDVETLQDMLVTDNQSLTGTELRKTLKSQIKEMLYSRLTNGDMLGLQTPLGFICMRNPKSTKPTPCGGKQQNQRMNDANIDKRFMRALQVSSLPNLDNCKGPECEHSMLIDNDVTKLLLESFHYYCSYLKGVGQHAEQDVGIHAQNFINLYYPSLKEVYPAIADTVGIA